MLITLLIVLSILAITASIYRQRQRKNQRTLQTAMEKELFQNVLADQPQASRDFRNKYRSWVFSGWDGIPVRLSTDTETRKLFVSALSHLRSVDIYHKRRKLFVDAFEMLARANRPSIRLACLCDIINWHDETQMLEVEELAIAEFGLSRQDAADKIKLIVETEQDRLMNERFTKNGFAELKDFLRVVRSRAKRLVQVEVHSYPIDWDYLLALFEPHPILSDFVRSGDISAEEAVMRGIAAIEHPGDLTEAMFILAVCKRHPGIRTFVGDVLFEKLATFAYQRQQELQPVSERPSTGN